MDRFDAIAIAGFGGIVLLSIGSDVEAFLLGAAVGGFVLSLSLWRFHAGRVWEGLGWLAWVGAAVVLVVGPAESPVLYGTFLATLLLGVGLQFGERFGVLPDIRTVDDG